MDTLNELAEKILFVFNYPFITLGKSSITLWVILFNILVVLAFFLVISKSKDFLIKSLSKRPGFDVSNWRAAITLGYYALMVAGLIAILQTTGLDLSVFTVLTGAIGIGVGIGMQGIFSNFISGVIILLEKPLKIGDRIEVGEVSGNVHSISVRATTVITNDNVSIIIPNSDFITKEVINWSHSGRRVRMNIPISVSYESDPQQVTDLLLLVASQEPAVLKSPAPKVHLAEFGENAIKFSLLVWTEEFIDRKGALKSLINYAVFKAFKENKIRMPFPQRDVHIRTQTMKEEIL